MDISIHNNNAVEIKQKPDDCAGLSLKLGKLSFTVPEPDSPGLPTISFDDELIILNKYTKKLVTLNSTASFVWKLLIQGHKSGSPLDSEAIARRLLAECGMDEDDYGTVLRDVEEILESFTEEKLLAPYGSVGDANEKSPDWRRST